MTGTLRERLRTALPAALRQRDAPLVSALRSTLAALDNAEAVPIGQHDPGSLALEATPVGGGTREVPRRDLSDEQVEQLVRAEVDERRAAARLYARAGQHDRAQRLGAEADALAAVAGLPPG